MGGAIIESGTPSKTQFKESKKSEKLASFIKALSSKLAGSIHDALFRAWSGCGPVAPVVVWGWVMVPTIVSIHTDGPRKGKKYLVSRQGLFVA